MAGFIGVLDIYGFEVFEKNSFEQLCINYANENLQRHFNKHMIEVEQRVYEEEGIDWTRIAFNDNQGCLDLIDGKPGGKPGVFAALDDQYRVTGEKANLEFVKELHKQHAGKSSGSRSSSKWSSLRAKVHKKHGKPLSSISGVVKALNDSANPFYKRPRLHADTRFCIRHYAGLVEYDVHGFNRKNIESFGDDIKLLCSSSNNSFFRNIFAATNSSNESPSKLSLSSTGANKSTRKKRRGSTLRMPSVSSQFKCQLRDLMNTLQQTTPHYIRCIKPNMEKKPLVMVVSECLRQLKNAGMMEVVRIRKQGFASRELHEDFFVRHKRICPSAKTHVELIEYISRIFHFSKDQWQQQLALMEAENRALREHLKTNGITMPVSVSPPNKISRMPNDDIQTAELLLHDIRSLRCVDPAQKVDTIREETKFSGVFGLIKEEVHSLLNEAKSSSSDPSAALAKDTGDPGAGGGPALAVALGTLEGSVPHCVPLMPEPDSEKKDRKELIEAKKQIAGLTKQVSFYQSTGSAATRMEARAQAEELSSEIKCLNSQLVSVQSKLKNRLNAEVRASDAIESVLAHSKEREVQAGKTSAEDDAVASTACRESEAKDIEEEVDRLVFAYKRSLKWQADMDSHITSLVNQLATLKKGGNIEQQLLKDQQQYLDTIASLQESRDHLDEQLHDTKRQLAMSEKGNAMLAAVSAIKADQLHAWRAGTFGSRSQNASVCDEEQELLGYMRAFAKTWGHGTYRELQALSNYNDEDDLELF
eukprot:g3569.t1